MPTKVIKLKAGQKLNRRTTVDSMLELVGVGRKGIAPAEAASVLRPKFESLFKSVRSSFRGMLTRSSVVLGPYQKAAYDENGARDTDTLYNSLGYTFAVKKLSSGRLVVDFVITSDAPNYNLLDEGWTNSDTPSISATLNWAIRHLPNWSGISPAAPGESTDTIFRRLRDTEIAPGVKADYAFLRLYEEMRNRRYAGLRLTENIVRFSNAALQRFATQGGILNPNELRAIFG